MPLETKLLIFTYLSLYILSINKTDRNNLNKVIVQWDLIFVGKIRPVIKSV